MTEYEHTIKLGAHLFSVLVSTRPLTEGSLEADIMNTYSTLVAEKFKYTRWVIISDILNYHKKRGLP